MHMWTWFHSEINDTVLFKNWHITTVNDMVIACVIFICVGILLEALKWVRWHLDLIYGEKLENYNHKTFYLQIIDRINILKTLLLILQMIISYILMLVFMTFSIWLCLSITIGISVGYFVFGNRIFNSPENEMFLRKRRNNC
uniref:Copper transport protein n=1 Tax=Strongyloides venezuelensis TaxID=75913 RepID=A0A0K0FLQ2_STRVS